MASESLGPYLVGVLAAYDTANGQVRDSPTAPRVTGGEWSETIPEEPGFAGGWL